MYEIATSRIVGLFIAIIGIAVSIWCGHDALRMNAEFQLCLIARPMESTIDLSQRGETTIPFRQTCCTPHGEALYLQCDLDDPTKQNVEELFRDFSGAVIIKDSAGNDVASAKINNETVRYWNDAIMLTGFTPFRTGDYIATIRVDSGTAALLDKQQTIYAKYQLCGIEQLPAMFTGAFAFGAGMIGVVSAGCVMPGLRRRGFRRDVPRETA
jgi:hypothetical protein